MCAKASFFHDNQVPHPKYQCFCGEIQESPALWYTAPQGTLIFGQPPMMISRGRSPENGKSRGTPEAMKKKWAAHEFFHLCGLTMAYVLRSFRPHVLFLTSLGITRRTNSAKFFQTRACSHVSRDLTTARLYHQSRGWREPIPVWVPISAEAVRSLAHTYCL